MRSIRVKLVALVLLVACSAVISADYKNPDRLTNSKPSASRLLRSVEVTTTATGTEAEAEERGFTLTPKWLTRFRIWKLKREATWDLNKTSKELAKEKLKADELLVKEAGEYTKWMKAGFNPEYIYDKLGLVALGNKATTSPNFRRYEAYLALWFEKANDVGTANWIKVWWRRYKLNRLKSKAAAEMKKAEEDLAKEVREYERWIKAKYTPEFIYEKLGLAALGARATKSKNFRHYEAYLRMWHERFPTSV
ncbi:hypothetical protein ON010_g9537 [Phytophthora cinnamomi]|nr:hypothetical protein ON010_g9537 [Phytophthora cinnamomi]